MNIIIFINNDIHAARALELLTPHLARHKIQIILSQKVGNVENLPAEIVAMKKIETIGSLEKIEKFAKILQAKISCYDNVNSEQALQNFRDFAPDLVISVRFGQIFKQPLIDIPKHGVLNLHSGILPQYRGILASFWAILHNEENIGTTLHYISNSGIDNGAIIAISKNKVDRSRTLLQSIFELYDAGCANLISAIKKIERNEKIETTYQEKLENSSYFSYPNENDIRKFQTFMNLFHSKS